jgi:hypothetical protein
MEYTAVLHTFETSDVAMVVMILLVIVVFVAIRFAPRDDGRGYEE